MSTEPETGNTDEAADAAQQDGQVSELAQAGEEPEPISPGDSVAGQPEGESGRTQEGTQGPDAPPVHGIPEPDNKPSR